MNARRLLLRTDFSYFVFFTTASCLSPLGIAFSVAIKLLPEVQLESNTTVVANELPLPATV